MPDLDPRTRDCLASRFRAGDSIADLADDYGVAPEQVEAALRKEWTPSFADAAKAIRDIRDWVADQEEEKESAKVCGALRTARACLDDAETYLDDADRADKEGR